MKNKIFPLVLFFPAVAGICGAFLRGSQIKEAHDTANGFISGGTLSSNGLFILSILVFAIAIGAALLFTKWFKLSGKDVSQTKIAVPFYISAALILAYAGLVLLPVVNGDFSAINLILGLFSVYCAASLFVLGRHNMAERESTAYCVMSAVPVFWACFMLVLTFREKISDPIIWDYVFHIFAYLSVLFSAYSITAHALGKNKKAIAVFTCFCGIFFFLIELVSPFISGGNIELTIAKITELIPSLAFLILLPFATMEILKKNNE